jgi:hypothetical protein
VFGTVLLVAALVGQPAMAVEQPVKAAESPVVQVVPAFDDDLPKGEAKYAAASGPAALAAAWSCTVYASDPRRSYYDVEGEGFQSCFATGWSPQRLAISIQRQRWYGWQTMDTEYIPYTTGNWSDRTIWYNCYNTGTWTYRVVVTGYAQGGRSGKSVQSENYLRTTC